jgi:hypothetical protein
MLARLPAEELIPIQLLRWGRQESAPRRSRPRYFRRPRPIPSATLITPL